MQNKEGDASPITFLPKGLEHLPDMPDAKRGRDRPRAGEMCPKCGQGRLDYDGLLNLTCTSCGYAWGGCFT